MKKVLIFMLVLYGSIVFTACTEKEIEVSDEPVKIVSIDEPVTLKWYLNGSNVTDDEDVMKAVNEYLQYTLNMTLEPIWGTWGEFDSGAVTSLEKKEDIDIYFTGSEAGDEYNEYARKGYWVRLDDPQNNLIELYGQELWEELPEDLKNGAVINGQEGYGVYAIPNLTNYPTQYGWSVNVTLLEKYGYTVEDIKSRTYFELGDIFAAVKAGEGDDFYPLYIDDEDILESIATHSIPVAGDGNGERLLAYFLNPKEVREEGVYGNTLLNRFATDEYKAFAEQSREYMMADMILLGWTKKQIGNAAQGNYLMTPVCYELGYEERESKEKGVEIAFVPSTPPFVETASAQRSMMAISAVSDNPERAMMFLNLLNTDPYLMCLLSYGIEDIHFYYNEDYLVEFTQERKNYQPWRSGMGNITILPATAEEGNYGEFGYFEVFHAYCKRAKPIPILGFTVDTGEEIMTMQKEELSKIAQYSNRLCCGIDDPATELPALNCALIEAGIDDYVGRAQQQLDEYLANRN